MISGLLAFLRALPAAAKLAELTKQALAALREAAAAARKREKDERVDETLDRLGRGEPSGRVPDDSGKR